MYSYSGEDNDVRGSPTQSEAKPALGLVAYGENTDAESSSGVSDDSLSSMPSTLSDSTSATPEPSLVAPQVTTSTDQEHGSFVLQAGGDLYLEPPSRFQDSLLGTLQRIHGHTGRDKFFPQSTFSDLVNEQTVAGELRRCGGRFESSTITGLSQTICGPQSFKRIFALLVLTDRLLDIQSFIDEDVADRNLPLSLIRHKDSHLFRLARIVDSNKPSQPLRCFDGWPAVPIWNFSEWQWTMLAPRFEPGKNKDVMHIILPDLVPLPFTDDSRYGVDAKAIQGGYSTVFKVKIHPSHHNLSSSQVRCPRSHATWAKSSQLTEHLQQISENGFAVKRLKTKDRAQFKREVDMLMTFSGDAHPHLISLHATYEQFNQFYLIFPLAEADLQGYWKEKNPTPLMDHDTVLWVAQQCCGIGSGLLQIHRHNTVNFSRLSHEDYQQIGHGSEAQWSKQNVPSWQLQLFGRHGDIKPQNVLWFQDPSDNADRGILKITDFGLAEFKTSTNNIYKPCHSTAVSAPYRSPEFDVDGGSVGQSHDIWALGCLYLELITWLLGGWTLVHKFQETRLAQEPLGFYDRITDGTFFVLKQASKDGAVVPAVKPAVSKVRSLPNAHPFPPTFTKYLYTDISLIDLLVHSRTAIPPVLYTIHP